MFVSTLTVGTRIRTTIQIMTLLSE